MHGSSRTARPPSAQWPCARHAKGERTLSPLRRQSRGAGKVCNLRTTTMKTPDPGAAVHLTNIFVGFASAASRSPCSCSCSCRALTSATGVPQVCHRYATLPQPSALSPQSPPGRAVPASWPGPSPPTAPRRGLPTRPGPRAAGMCTRPRRTHLHTRHAGHAQVRCVHALCTQASVHGHSSDCVAERAGPVRACTPTTQS